MEDLICKAELRLLIKDRLASLASRRQVEASQALEQYFLLYLSSYQNVLSFSSFKNEISTRGLNKVLAKKGYLILPRIECDQLSLYRVPSTKDLIPNQWGILEPNPIICKSISYSDIDFALIPAVGLNHKGHRLGYGKGFYDRLLPSLRGAFTMGLGFREQYLPLIPLEPHDQTLSGALFL